ncbi:MAG TPA: hypothetical protein PKM21_15430 [Anaerolineales bacterium]|nr:hypothetical protein [Anaerolineales bacterium]
MHAKKLTIISIILSVLFLGVIGAAAQTGSQPESGLQTGPEAVLHNNFTYQGYITDETGVPLTDECNIRFGLWDAASGGSQIGTYDDNNADVQIVDGYFTASVNDGNEFGSTSFNGQARYLSISLTCTDFQETLSPRQPLTAVPYAIYAMNLPDHNHLGEVWQGAASPAGLTVINDGVAGVGLVVAGPGGDTGRALAATGGIYSTADSELYLSPHTAVQVAGSDLTFTYSTYGKAKIVPPSSDGASRYISIPVSTFGSLLGSDVYVKSLDICYQITNAGPAFVTSVGVYQYNGTNTDTFLIDNTDRNSTTEQCFTVTATTRLPIENSSYVQIVLDSNGADAGEDGVIISTVKLTLTEDATP